MHPIIENKFIEDKPRWAGKKNSHSPTKPRLENKFSKVSNLDGVDRKYYWTPKEIDDNVMFCLYALTIVGLAIGIVFGFWLGGLG